MEGEMAISSLKSNTEDENSPQLLTASNRVKGILTATDFSEQATLALKIAARLAKQFHSRLHVLYVESPQVDAPGAGVLAPVLQAVDIEQARKQLHEYVSAIPEMEITRHEEIVSTGPTVEVLLETAETKGIDLVVLGSHGRGGLKKVVLGSVAEAAVRGLHCPVLIVGPRCVQPYHRLKSVIFVTGLFHSSAFAAECAISIARETGAPLTVAHVLPPREGEADSLGMGRWDHAAKEVRRLVPHDALIANQVHYEILTGAPAEEILRIAEQKKAGVLVMGTKGNAVLADHAPWATLTCVIRNARCPVLAVQPHCF
jgi:nucleotide-binding universal stress UspA family protein